VCSCDPGQGPSKATLVEQDIERIPLDHGVWQADPPTALDHWIRRQRLQRRAGQPVIEPHDETSVGAGCHQELYLVASGAATFTVAEETVEAPAGALIAVERGDARGARHCGRNDGRRDRRAS
jgi:hypothetical protein